MSSRIDFEIDLSLLQDNFEKIRTHVAPAKLMPVLKSNAYGLGVLPIAELLKKAGAELFGVAEINEALQLTPLNLPIQILGNLLPDEIEEAVRINLVCPLNCLRDAQKINAEAIKQHKSVFGALTIDTGMGRLGMIAENAFPEIQEIAKLSNLKIIGIYSHFSSAFNQSDNYTQLQFDRFNHLYRQLEKAGFTFKYVHIGASDAISNFPQCSQSPFNLVRSGINMYGYCDNNIINPSVKLQGIVALKTKIASVRTLPQGSFLGYGRMHKLAKASRIGTIAIGYADGMPLALSNRGYVIIQGVLCPVLGRISMDYTTVLLDNVPQCVEGDEVVCIGKQGDYEIKLEDWANLKGTHAYEILCSIGARAHRKYI